MGDVTEPGEMFTSVLLPCEGVPVRPPDGLYVREYSDPREADSCSEYLKGDCGGGGASGSSTSFAGGGIAIEGAYIDVEQGLDVE